MKPEEGRISEQKEIHTIRYNNDPLIGQLQKEGQVFSKKKINCNFGYPNAYLIIIVTLVIHNT